MSNIDKFSYHLGIKFTIDRESTDASSLPLFKTGARPSKRRRWVIIAVAVLLCLIVLLASASAPTIPVPEPPPENSTTEHEEEEPLQADGNKAHNPFLTMFPERPPLDEERFLGYIPHSGFHNQRLALESALLLASYLNRTLLLPPLYLSDKAQNIPWGPPSSTLTRWSALERTQEQAKLCRNYDPTVLPQKTPEQLEAMSKKDRFRETECRRYHGWTLTPWTYFYDLPKVLRDVVGVGRQTEPIQVFDRPNVTIAWMTDRLGIKDVDTEIYWINDTTRFHVRVLDDSEHDYRAHPEPPRDPTTWKGRYTNTMLLSDLKARTERVIHFGSLFGIERVEARSESNQLLQRFITHSLDIWNQPILDATKVAEAQIDQWITMTGRAVAGFLGAHLRTADGGFKNVIPQSIEHIVVWLREMVKQDKEKHLASNNTLPPSSLPGSSSEPAIKRRQDPKEAPAVDPTFLESCMGKPSESPMIFLATDVHHPRAAPLMTDYWKEFPCTMVFSDFPEPLSILDGIRNTVDNVHMLPYMIALMDANLAAKGREFQGTDKSTFSIYITDHLWPEYHPDRPRPSPHDIFRKVTPEEH
ncbi:hypothetical protein K493DRAFT_359659 [Basidiobolus meristosporus CBS 931.73]|uniref:O-fucosyltransferase family protein n=1 Tax=Basidiobolus meristosporus CBS 931.73 TaxID=1314790 RepID=A0A1Y1XRN4_9FUNG|nr:hypothetical protein K493DRAFT_359659 [Basidiobolus meristosporus CBS 931.73]|eukprot:ORX88325.1 hypothetical protein K493DRAFT_359659 [Basidiobolus meristosporus CBS 931.73]